VLRPLFPGYVFVRVNNGFQRWRPILSTFGVRTLIQCGGKPSLLDDSFIQTMKLREVDGAINREIDRYQIGQQVRLEGGAFDGVVATIVEMDEKDRLVVLMSILNQSVRLKVEQNSVTAM
jgi:transcriptional antiterminator RfaH